MAIKLPDNFRPSDYGIELSIPKPDIECKKNKDGSFSLRAVYTYDGISDFAREAASEMKDKMEAELIDELLRLNGYVPYRTCRNVADNYDGMGFVCSECTRAVPEDEFGPEIGEYCPGCGAKVVGYAD